MAGWWLVREKSCCLRASGLLVCVEDFFLFTHLAFSSECSSLNLLVPIWIFIFTSLCLSWFSDHMKQSGCWVEWGCVMFTKFCISTSAFISVQKYNFWPLLCTPFMLLMVACPLISLKGFFSPHSSWLKKQISCFSDEHRRLLVKLKVRKGGGMEEGDTHHDPTKTTKPQAAIQNST